METSDSWFSINFLTLQWIQFRVQFPCRSFESWRIQKRRNGEQTRLELSCANEPFEVGLHLVCSREKEQLNWKKRNWRCYPWKSIVRLFLVFCSFSSLFSPLFSTDCIPSPSLVVPLLNSEANNRPLDSAIEQHLPLLDSFSLPSHFYFWIYFSS